MINAASNSNFIIYNDFIDKHLLSEWQKLYIKLKGNYNLNPEWCSLWFKHFGDKDKKLFIYTLWENNELLLLAPFYIKDNVLYLIGSKPDFYDELNILSVSPEHTESLAKDIFDRNLKVDFRLINSENEFAKLFFREAENSNKIRKKIYYSTLKFHADANFKFKKSFSYRIKRKITSSNNKFNKNLVFEFETEKNPDYFEEMLSFHKNRWNLFHSKEKEQFIRDLYFNTDQLVLSRLCHEGSDHALSYQMAYRNFDRFCICISAYNQDYEVISPSLLVHYKFFEEAYKNGYSDIDFGVGIYPYKYNFSNNKSIVFSIKTDTPFLKKYDSIYNPLKELISKLTSLST